ncbi:MAG TPA: BON domain-containing protein [Aestuariivirgaceae bacterium]|jgi:osmotically-inducible protein OsmY
MYEAILRQHVRDELEFEPRIDATHINVAADNGVAALSGYVTSYAEKQAAIAAARRVKGVRAIVDEIDVRLPSDKKVADKLIAKRAIDVLAWDPMVPSSAVQVLVHEGWITLTGNVEWNYQKQAAENDVLKLSGVLGVTNEIRIVPEIEAVEVKNKIEKALRRHAGVEANAIQVTIVDKDTVVLEGEVDNWEEQNAVENAAWSAPGVKLVDDRLRVLRQPLT